MVRGKLRPTQRVRLETIAELEGLRGTGAAIEFLIREYNSFPPGYPGGYIALRKDYSRRLEEAAAGFTDAGVGLADRVANYCPLTFIESRGIRNVRRLVADCGPYGARKVAPLQAEFQAWACEHGVIETSTSKH